MSHFLIKLCLTGVFHLHIFVTLKYFSCSPLFYGKLTNTYEMLLH